MGKKEGKKRKASEAAALSGLFLNRLADMAADSIEGDQTVIRIKDLNQIFGEALQQFSTKEEAPSE
jgi:hypothetical protein